MKRILLTLIFIAGIVPLQAIIVENKTDTMIQLLYQDNISDIQEKKLNLNQLIEPGKSFTCFCPEFLIKASDRTFIISKNMITDNKTRVVVALNKFLGEVTVTLKNEEMCYGDYEF